MAATKRPTKKEREIEALLVTAANEAASSNKLDQEDRVILVFSEEEMAVFNKYAEAVVLGSVCKAAEKVGNQVKETALDKFLALAWERKATILNPEIVTYLDKEKKKPNSQAIFVLKNSFSPDKVVPSFKKRDPNKTPRNYIAEALSAGTPEQGAILPNDAIEIVKKEIEVVESISIANLYDLMRGKVVKGKRELPDKKARAAAEKLMVVLLAKSTENFIGLGLFTSEERQYLLETEEMIRVIDETTFFEHALKYAKSLAQLKRIMQVFQPDLAITSVKIGLSASTIDNPNLQAAFHVLGIEDKPKK